MGTLKVSERRREDYRECRGEDRSSYTSVQNNSADRFSQWLSLTNSADFRGARYPRLVELFFDTVCRFHKAKKTTLGTVSQLMAPDRDFVARFETVPCPAPLD